MKFPETWWNVAYFVVYTHYMWLAYISRQAVHLEKGISKWNRGCQAFQAWLDNNSVCNRIRTHPFLVQLRGPRWNLKKINGFSWQLSMLSLAWKWEIGFTDTHNMASMTKHWWPLLAGAIQGLNCPIGYKRRLCHTISRPVKCLNFVINCVRGNNANSSLASFHSFERL